MLGVSFDRWHSFRSWGLLLTKPPQISLPKPKLRLVQVPGSDQIIDLTESLTGQVHYQPRTLFFEFLLLGERVQREAACDDLLSRIHGKRMDVTLDEDPNWFYRGRVVVETLTAGETSTALTVRVEAEPYRLQRHGEGRRL